MGRARQLRCGTSCIALLACALLLQAAPAAAQIEEIMVTANKRAESLQNVPAAVTAVGQSFLNEIQANTLADYAAYVPGLTLVSTGANANRLILRGITTGPNDLGATVGVYIDDSPFGSSTGISLGALLSPDLDPFNLERVEVLRGPQGTLYGASTLGGLIKYVSKAPSLTAIQSSARLDVSETEHGGMSFSARGAISLPIVEGKVGFRASVYRTYGEGATTDVVTGQDNLNGSQRYGVKTALLFQPSDELSIRLNTIMDRSRTPNIGSVQGNNVTLQPIYGENRGTNAVAQSVASNSKIFQLSATWDGPISVTSATSYSNFGWNNQGDLTDTYHFVVPAFAVLPGIGSYLNSSTRKFTQELRLASPTVPPGSQKFEWLAGAFYDFEKSTYVSNLQGFANRTTVSPTVFGNILAATNYIQYREYAAFGNLTYYITPTLDVTAGARWSRNEQSRLVNSNGLLNQLTAPFVNFRSSLNPSSEGVWTYNFDVRWRPDAQTTLYARAARGYRPGGPQSLPPGQIAPGTPLTYASDTLWNYEAGVKATALDGKLSGDLSVFYIDWTNIQLNFFDANGRTAIGNAGKAVSKGVELQGQYAPFQGFIVAGNLAYTDAYVDADALAVGARSGDQLPFISKWSGALRADWSIPLDNGIDGRIGGSWRYRSSYNASFTGDPGTRGYHLGSQSFVDLRSGVTWGAFDLSFQILNLFDERKVASASLYGPYNIPAVIGFTQGRTYGLSLLATF